VSSSQPQQSEFLEQAKEHYLEDTEKSKRRGFVGTLINAAEVIGGAIVLAIIINQFVFQPYEVVGISMAPTLQNSDRLIVSKIPATWAKITRHKYVPKRYDVVVLKNSLANRFATDGGDIQLVKRVIGLPGDKVTINNGKITIYNKDNPNGFNPDENLVTKDITTTPDGFEAEIKDGEIFVCGDNRSNSLDSRSKDVGTVPVEHVVGHVRLRLLPLNKARFF
jgi:signal peptidase I